MNLVEKHLPEGTRVFTLAPFESELVTLMVAFHVGFAHESREQLGISHMVEHLCFSDNETHTFPEFRSEIEELGGTFNGFTHDTITVYTLTVLADHWQEGLKILKDIVLHPRFGAEACDREIKVLLAETGQFRQRWLAWFYERGWFKNSWTLLQDMVWAPHMHCYRTFHRYKDLTSQMLSAWHTRHYRQDNMAVIAVGRVDSEEVLRETQRLFETWPTETTDAIEHPKPTTIEEDTYVNTRIGTPFSNQSVVTVGAWNCGGMSSERAVCDVIQEHLQNRAFDSLRVDHSLAYWVGCGFDGRRNGGKLVLRAQVKRGNEEEAKRLLEGVLAKASKDDISDKGLNGLRNKLLARYAHMNANPGWYAHELVLGAFGEYPVGAEDYPTQLREVTPSQIREVLSRLTAERGRIVSNEIPLLSVPATVCAALGVFVILLGALLSIIF